MFFSRTTEPISTKLGMMHPCVKGIQVSSNTEQIHSNEVKNVFLSSLIQRYDINICVYWFKLVSQVSDMAHGPLVFCSFALSIIHNVKNNIFFSSKFPIWVYKIQLLIVVINQFAVRNRRATVEQKELLRFIMYQILIIFSVSVRKFS